MAAASVYRCLLIGAPASGKGTISNKIVNKFNFQHISSGDLLRWNIETATRAGRKAAEYVQSGKLVPDEVVTDCVLEKLQKPHPRILLDGFPRTLGQAAALDRALTLDAVIHLMVPYEIIIERVKSRWIHKASGRTYNVGFNDPKVPYKDDVTGEDLIQREDDKPEVVAARMKYYDELTKPILAYYKTKNLVTDIYGETSAQIWPHVDKFLTAALAADDKKPKVA